MQAVVVRRFGSFHEARIEAVEDPGPGPGEVVVAVEVAEANYPDLLMMEGRYQVKPALPFVPGKGAAGRVAALGDGVTGLGIGDRVALQVEHGAYAEKVVVPRNWCYPVPDGVHLHDAAASVLTYQTAWFALTDRAGLEPGQSVLVLGAGGGVGIAAVQLARALGAGLVVGGTRGAAKADLVRKAGADHVVDLGADNLRDALRAQIHAITDGRGVDVIIDPVGGSVFEPALRALGWRGRLVVIGFTGGEIPTVRANYLLVRNISVLGLQGSDYRNRWPDACARAQETIFKYIERGTVRPEIGMRYPFARFAEALTALRDGEARGKLLLVPDRLWTPDQ
jgi:NADPH2:quinone reductase